MTRLRALFREYRKLSLLLVLLALCLRAAVPAGTMLAAEPDGIRVLLCDGSGLATHATTIPLGHKPPAASDHPCAFGVLAFAALGAPPVLAAGMPVVQQASLPAPAAYSLAARAHPRAHPPQRAPPPTA